MRTNTKKTRWSRRYHSALRKHLRHGPGVNMPSASGLGREAVSLGLQTLDVAKVHEQALTALVSRSGAPGARLKAVGAAKSFFAETIVPIEKTHRAARKTTAQVDLLLQTLRKRTSESSASTRRLKQSVDNRLNAEKSLKKSGQQHSALLTKSHHLQKDLRKLTRTILSAQENERQKTSRHLHDEIAQILIAIELRLLTLKQASKAGTAGLKKEIAYTQRLVRKSTLRLKQNAHELSRNQET